MRTEAAAREGRGFFLAAFGVRVIEALIQFKAAVRRRHWIRLHGLRRSLHSSVGRHLAIYALLPETSPSADEKLIGKC
jgi:hypothetical protein